MTSPFVLRLSGYLAVIVAAGAAVAAGNWLSIRSHLAALPDSVTFAESPTMVRQWVVATGVAVAVGAAALVAARRVEREGSASQG